MKTIPGRILVSAFAIALGACASQPGAPGSGETAGEARADPGLDAPPAPLTGEWAVQRVTSAGGEVLEPSGVSFIVGIGDDGDAQGQAACNRWNAQVERVDRERLRFGAVGVTRAACGLETRALVAFERRFVNNLTRTMEWEREAGVLRLRFQDGETWELRPAR